MCGFISELSVFCFVLCCFVFFPLIYISVSVPVPYCLDDCGFVVEPEVVILFNFLAAFIRTVRFLLPGGEKKKKVSFGLQNSSLPCLSYTYSSPRYNVWPLCLALFRCHVLFSNIYLFSYVACEILVHSPGMEPVQSHKHWISREVP